MASTSLLSSIFVLIALLVMNIHPSAGIVPVPGPVPEKVNVSLYYESLCPGSLQFISEEFSVLLVEEDLLSIVNLHLVPYGNARTQPPNNVTCQYGPLECYYNTIEACAIDVWPDVYLPFIACVEESFKYKEATEPWVSCCRALQLNPGTIKECYESGRGNELILRNGRETDALNPPHEYVPWVIVNGLPLHQDLYNFISYVCDAYKGPPPEACKNRTNSTSSYPVCYAGPLKSIAAGPDTN